MSKSELTSHSNDGTLFLAMFTTAILSMAFSTDMGSTPMQVVTGMLKNIAAT